jgi:hypothetical protein
MRVGVSHALCSYEGYVFLPIDYCYFHNFRIFKKDMNDSDFHLELPENFHAENREHNDFMELYLAFKKRGKLKQVYDSFGDQYDPEKTIIVYKKALIETEEELAKNPASIFMREQKAELENNLAKICKILGKENQPKEAEAVKADNNEIDIAQRILDLPETPAVTNKYPKFKKDIPLLLEHEYITLVKGKLKWIKAKQALAEYFGFMQIKDNNSDWVIIERLFDGIEKGKLKGVYWRVKNGETQKSKDYQKWEEIKKKH